jgi:hypothetical protein
MKAASSDLDDRQRRVDRRRVLRDLGLAAGAEAGIAAFVDSTALAAATAVTAINVKDAPYNATGNARPAERVTSAAGRARVLRRGHEPAERPERRRVEVGAAELSARELS